MGVTSIGYEVSLGSEENVLEIEMMAILPCECTKCH